MPELPEVQTTINGLQLIVKKHITNIKLNTKKLRNIIPKNIIQIAQNKKIINIYRLGKYIIFDRPYVHVCYTNLILPVFFLNGFWSWFSPSFGVAFWTFILLGTNF